MSRSGLIDNAIVVYVRILLIATSLADWIHGIIAIIIHVDIVIRESCPVVMPDHIALIDVRRELRDRGLRVHSRVATGLYVIYIDPPRPTRDPALRVAYLIEINVRILLTKSLVWYRADYFVRPIFVVIDSPRRCGPVTENNAIEVNPRLG